MLHAKTNLLASPAGRRWLFATLYLSEGAPIGFVWWAMPTLLRDQGVDLASITQLTALATLPWVLKFLAAPAIDASLRRGAKLKHWIVVCQLAMAGLLLPLLWIDWNAQFSLVVAFLVAHALFAAVQDVSIDTLAIRTVPESELGRVNGAMQAGMLGGRAGVAAGSAVVVAAVGTPGAAALCVAVLIVAPAALLVLATIEPRIEPPRVRFAAAWRLLASRAALAGVAIALLGGAGFEFFGVSAGPKLVDLGGSETTTALFYGLFAPGGLALGAALGGMFADRAGVIRATAGSLAAVTLALVAVAAADSAAFDLGQQVALFAVAYVAIGALTASSYALFMTLSRGAFSATRFSVFMAMTNACEAWAGYAGGRFAASSYGLTLLALSAVACVAAIPLYILAKIRPREKTDDHAVLA
jgi:MFS transporter, PAT family, beta-lactamase induction signal transducer AmpG